MELWGILMHIAIVEKASLFNKFAVKIFFFTIILLPFFSFSQEIKGRIIDKETNNRIPFAKVFFVELETGTIADSNGIFHIEHYNQDEIHLQISAFGYERIDTIVALNNSVELQIYLSQNHLEIEEVIVTASTGKLEKDNIVSIDKRKLEELYQNSPISLAEAISNIPGVDQNSTGASIGKPVIRGLSGNRIVTYSQGIRVENQQWGSEHGLGIGAVGIEGVEVIKGPSSLLYGSDALGGVLYFIDERFANHDAFEIKAKTMFQSNTMGTINQLGLKIHKGFFKINLFGGYTSHADYQTPDFENVYNTRFDEKNIKLAIGFNVKNWISSIRYSYLENNFGIVEDSTFTQTFARTFVLPFQNIKNHSVSFENKFFVGASSLSFILGHTSNNRKEFEDNTTNEALGLLLNTSTYNLKWKTKEFYSFLHFVVGSQGMYQTNKNSGEEILIPDARTEDVGIFTTINFNFKRLKLLAGYRYDNRFIDTRFMQTSDATFNQLNRTFQGQTFSAGARYNFKKVVLKGNVSSGFRAPNTSELLSNGVHEGTNRYERGNNDLKNERATQLDISIDYQSDHFSFSINPFYNSINDYIYLSPADTIINNNPVFDYKQTSAMLYGGEVDFHYHPHKIHWLHIESNFSTVIAEDKNHNPLPLIPQSRINSTFAAELSQKGKVQIKRIFIQYMYKFKQERVSQFETNSGEYHLVNLGLEIEVPTKRESIKLSTGVKNLFNSKYVDHLSRLKNLQIPNQGINFYLNLSYVFGDKLKK